MKRTLRNLFLPLCLIVAVSLFYSCDNLNMGNAFLERPPEVSSTIDTVFGNAKYAKQFLWDVYRTLPYGTYSAGNFTTYDSDLMQDDPLANITDIGYSFGVNGGCLNLYYPGAYSAQQEAINSNQTKFNFYSSGAWAGIRKGWIFINHIDQVPDMDQQTKERLKAEARLIIAIHYVDLFRNYGGMIWVGKAYGPNDDFQNPRMTAMATVDSTLKLIDEAIPHLPWTLTNPAQNSGRLTKASAMGLKVRLLLFAASPLFNSDRPFMAGEASDKYLVWYGGYHPDLWQKTVAAAKKFIQTNQQNGMPYHLSKVSSGNPTIQDYRDAFQHGYFDRDSPELLISTRRGYKQTFYQSFLINRGNLNVTQNYVEMFPMEDGTPITASGSTFDADHPYQNRDPRLYETVNTNGDHYQGRTAELYIGGRERPQVTTPAARTSYQERKFVLDITTSTRKPSQWPYLRLPEIYLSYAEALDMVNKGPTAEAYKYVNKVRNRVGLDDLKPGLDQKQFRISVLKERAREFGYEDVRWFDLIRWKMQNIFTEQLYGMRICSDGSVGNGVKTDPSLCGKSGYGGQTFLYQKYKLAPRFWQTHFSPKWYLSAFPKTEMQKKYGLIQNPGW